MIESILQEIGLTQNEIKTYLALLELGEAKTGAILKPSGLNSGKIYETLDALQKKGLVSEIESSGVKKFSPANPKRVLNFLEEKKEKIQQQEEDYNKVLPELLNKINSNKAETRMEIKAEIKGKKTEKEKKN